MTEKAIQFGPKQSLVGILSEPDATTDSAKLPVVIMLNAGMLHRIGPNRIYVNIARKLADLGFLTFRFDFSGIGDSYACEENTPFSERSILETKAAMNFLAVAKGANSFILMGICLGANIACIAAAKDSRVTGLIGINGFYLNSEDRENISHLVQHSIKDRYYRKHRFSIKNWTKLVSGRSNLNSIANYVVRKLLSKCNPKQNNTVPKVHESTLTKTIEMNIDTLLVYSEGSTALDTFRLTLGESMQNREKVGVKILKDADHSFTLVHTQERLVELIAEWLENKHQIKTADTYMTSSGESCLLIS